MGPSSYLLTPNTNCVPLPTSLSDLDPLPLSTSPTTDISSSSPPQYQPQSRQSTRISNPPSYLADYHCYSISTKSQPSKVLYPLSSVLSYSQCSPTYHHFCCSISTNPEPSTFQQANKLECWRHAMNIELQALADNHTWALVNLPPGSSMDSAENQEPGIKDPAQSQELATSFAFVKSNKLFGPKTLNQVARE
ncbi:hypothetical protein KIW84_023717 [Lathyrus oleraceus]|uniref:Uncharacterized protein n=1 Tax=Pisum sativum TaxID=3888 RepID=A0A9D4YG60_PEA|nr:hypothetical protein KIW84_023717 [Pisum sativum]